MPRYEIDFTYKVEEYGVVDLEADSLEQAEEFAREHIKEAYSDVTDVNIDTIREISR